MTNTLFFIQYSSGGSSSRGVLSGGIILDMDDICDEEYIRSLLRGRWKMMYQVGRKPLKDIISIRLDEFERVFYPNGALSTLGGIKHLLGYRDIKPVFRKEVLDKYGPHANEDKPSTTTSYTRGQVIRGADRVCYVYVGQMDSIRYIVDGHTEYSTHGNMYIPVDWLKGKYGSVVAASAISSVEVVADYLMTFLGRYTRIERYLLSSKRRALEVWKDVVGVNVSWLMQNNGENVLRRVAERSMLYNYNRKVEIYIKYKV